jgi:hypothetical protein
MAQPTPNFVLLDPSLPDVARVVTAMVQAHDAVESRSWSHPQEPATEDWWADLLADPRARRPKRRSSDMATIERTFDRLADELRDTILVACSKCDWKAAFRRDELIAEHGLPARCRACSNVSPRPAAPRSARNGIAAACTTSSLWKDRLVRSFVNARRVPLGQCTGGWTGSHPRMLLPPGSCNVGTRGGLALLWQMFS